MRSPTTIEERRTYWPRFGPAVPPPDFHDDRSCQNCGYNLRGLAYNDACPECGSVGGMSPSDEPLPFDERQTFGAYVATMYQILIEPADFGSHVWREGKLNWRAARAFRHTNIAIGFVSIGLVMFILMSDVMDLRAAMLAWSLSMLGVLLWLNRTTLDRLKFLEEEGLFPRNPQRTKALISYLSAPLALSPIQLPALYASRAALASDEGFAWPAAVGIHALLLLVQFLLVSQADANLLWQLIEMPKAQARAMGVGGAVVRVIIALFYCAGLPLMFVAIAKQMV